MAIPKRPGSFKLELLESRMERYKSSILAILSRLFRLMLSQDLFLSSPSSRLLERTKQLLSNVTLFSDKFEKNQFVWSSRSIVDMSSFHCRFPLSP